MENKHCKKCSKELADDSKYKLCEDCQEKRKRMIKRILIAAGAVGITAASAAILTGLASIKREEGNGFEYGYDKDDDYYDDSDDCDDEDFYEDDEVFGGIPVGCRACGGEYPNCTTSCPMFDD